MFSGSTEVLFVLVVDLEFTYQNNKIFEKNCFGVLFFYLTKPATRLVTFAEPASLKRLMQGFFGFSLFLVFSCTTYIVPYSKKKSNDYIIIAISDSSLFKTSFSPPPASLHGSEGLNFGKVTTKTKTKIKCFNQKTWLLYSFYLSVCHPLC